MLIGLFIAWVGAASAGELTFTHSGAPGVVFPADAAATERVDDSTPTSPVATARTVVITRALDALGIVFPQLMANGNPPGTLTLTEVNDAGVATTVTATGAVVGGIVHQLTPDGRSQERVTFIVTGISVQGSAP